MRGKVKVVFYYVERKKYSKEKKIVMFLVLKFIEL